MQQRGGDPSLLMSRSSTQIAWAAGMFEGEGCVSTCGPNRVVMQPWGTDEDSVRQFHECVGVGRVNGPYKRHNPSHTGNPAKDQWLWACGARAQMEAVVRAMWPYLRSRRRAKIVELGLVPKGD